MKDLKNTVTLIGHVGQEPKIVNFENGGKIARLSIATGYSYKNQKGEKVEDTQWHNLVMRNGLVKIVENYVEKGQQIMVEGRLTYRSWEDKEGRKHYHTEVLVNDMQLMGGRK